MEGNLESKGCTVKHRVLQRVPSSPEDPRGTQILMTADPTASFAQANDKFLVFRNDILLKKSFNVLLNCIL